MGYIKIHNLILLLLIPIAMFSQSVDYVKYYHKPILQAENYIIKEQFDSALFYYKKAFSNVPYGFLGDYSSAVYIAHKANKNQIALQFLDSAVIKGLIPTDKKYKIYFKNDNEWQDYLNNKYPKLKVQGLQTINKQTVIIIDSLYKIDQKYRSFNKDVQIAWDLLDNQDSLNAMCLKKLFINGHLTIAKIGNDAYFKATMILLHKLLYDDEFMYYCYKNGFIDKYIYYYAVSRKSLQFKQESKYITFSKDKNIIKAKNKARKQDGIVSSDKFKYLKRFARKSKGLYSTSILD